MIDVVLHIQRILETNRYTLSTFNIGAISGKVLEPPAQRFKSGFGTALPSGLYHITWVDIYNPKYRFNFSGQVPLIYNHFTPVSKYCIFCHGQRVSDNVNNLLVGSDWNGVTLQNSVKKLKELVDYIKIIGIEKIAVQVRDIPYGGKQ